MASIWFRKKQTPTGLFVTIASKGLRVYNTQQSSEQKTSKVASATFRTLHSVRLKACKSRLTGKGIWRHGCTPPWRRTNTCAAGCACSKALTGPCEEAAPRNKNETKEGSAKQQALNIHHSSQNKSRQMENCPCAAHLVPSRPAWPHSSDTETSKRAPTLYTSVRAHEIRKVSKTRRLAAQRQPWIPNATPNPRPFVFTFSVLALWPSRGPNNLAPVCPQVAYTAATVSANFLSKGLVAASPLPPFPPPPPRSETVTGTSPSG